MTGNTEEQDSKRQRVAAEPSSSLNINGAVVVEYETKTLGEISAAPVTALQGIGPVAEEALAELGIKTVSDLASYKCVPFLSGTAVSH
jgi:predicted flap endonuclease-1-like 5' DNA nuclease